jgi:hypothetical protein
MIRPAQIGDYFPFKDKVSDPKRQSLVVYRLKCMDCDAEYIGKSERILNERIHEHLKDKESHVFQHILNEKHRIDVENVEILDRASNDLKLQLKEMLYIRKFNPSLNRQMNSDLFTLVIRNIQQNNSIMKDIQKYLDKPKKQSKSTK